jgi:methylphosphotriester-DNA--protein-cysteine methyltransferase
MRTYRLVGPDGRFYESERPGVFGGNARARIYGRLDCPSAIRALRGGYARHRVFFADEAAAVAAGYRPCGSCLREAYGAWRRGAPLSPAYAG